MGRLAKDHKAPASITLLFLTAVGLLVGFTAPQAMGEESPGRTTVSILVKDAKTDEPIQNARLTLQFRDERKFKRDKPISYSAKTNPQGRYKFTHIPKGTVRLLVTADHHQAFGQEFEIEQDNQVIEVKLRKPQPLL